MAAIIALAVSALVSGCGGSGEDKEIKLGSVGWDENVAVSALTKALLEDELGYERVEVSTADLDTTYREVASGELDAFQDVWLPNQEALLGEVAQNVEHLDPWFLGETMQGMAVPAYMDVKSIDQLNGTDADVIIGIEPSAVVRQVVAEEVMPAYGLEQMLVEGPTEGMLVEVERRYKAREEFAFLAWSPHWMNRTYDIRYLEDPKDAFGELNDPVEVSTIVKGNLRDEEPAAHALMDALALTEEQIDGLEYSIREEEEPLAGARRWASENRDVVRSWVDAARDAQEET